MSFGHYMTNLNMNKDAKNYLWRLRKYNVITIYKDADQIRDTIGRLNVVWRNINQFKYDKYIRRVISNNIKNKK